MTTKQMDTVDAEAVAKKTTARKPASPPAPEVHRAMANILASLGVAKSGQLPSNMGGKPYITAVDVAQEVKRLFVENDLIFLPAETLENYQVIDTNGKKAIFIAVTLKATIVSTRDGSSVEIGGTGDGLANGTAVASNIASTNAFKNALLRTFLITEQSVEDTAKNGDQDTSAAGRAVATAAGGGVKVNRAAAQKGLKDTIREDYIEKGVVTGPQVNEYLAASKAKGLAGDAAWSDVLETLKGLPKASE